MMLHVMIPDSCAPRASAAPFISAAFFPCIPSGKNYSGTLLPPFHEPACVSFIRTRNPRDFPAPVLEHPPHGHLLLAAVPQQGKTRHRHGIPGHHSSFPAFRLVHPVKRDSIVEIG